MQFGEQKSKFLILHLSIESELQFGMFLKFSILIRILMPRRIQYKNILGASNFKLINALLIVINRVSRLGALRTNGNANKLSFFYFQLFQ